MRRMAVWGAGAAVAAAIAIAACGGGGGGTPTAPSGGGGGGGGTPPPAGTTITIGADGRVTPNSLTVSTGTRVTFVNNHNRQHDMSSDPHPEHTDCPEITVGNLQPGQQRETQNLTRVRTCGFHDHNENVNTALQGTIRIQ